MNQLDKHIDYADDGTKIQFFNREGKPVSDIYIFKHYQTALRHLETADKMYNEAIERIAELEAQLQNANEHLAIAVMGPKQHQPDPALDFDESEKELFLQQTGRM